MVFVGNFAYKCWDIAIHINYIINHFKIFNKEIVCMLSIISIGNKVISNRRQINLKFTLMTM